jgi:hypothetical protein
MAQYDASAILMEGGGEINFKGVDVNATLSSFEQVTVRSWLRARYACPSMRTYSSWRPMG